MNCLYYPTNTINGSSRGYLVLHIVFVRGGTALTAQKKSFFRNLLGFTEKALAVFPRNHKGCQCIFLGFLRRKQGNKPVKFLVEAGKLPGGEGHFTVCPVPADE